MSETEDNDMLPTLATTRGPSKWRREDTVRQTYSNIFQLTDSL